MIVSGLTHRDALSQLRFQEHSVDMSLTLKWYRENINDIYDPMMFKKLFGDEVDLTKENLLKMSIYRDFGMACFDIEKLAYVLLNDTGYNIFYYFACISKSHQLWMLRQAFNDLDEKLAGPFAHLNAELKKPGANAKALYDEYYAFREIQHKAYYVIVKREWESYRMQIASMLYYCLPMLNDDILVHL